MPNKPAPCGLRTTHEPHPFGDADEDWCDGKQPPDHYDARHRGRYRPEGGWWPAIMPAISCKHRRAGQPVLLDEPPAPRPRTRLLWRDRSLIDEDTG